MSRLYSCIISTADKAVLASIAHKFSHAIEIIDDGVLFDISGLERLIGKPERITQRILKELTQNNIPGSVAVAETIDTVTLLARQRSSEEQTLRPTTEFEQLPLTSLGLEQDTLNVFTDLGLYRVQDLLSVPANDLVNRYGREFESVIRTIRQKGDRLLTPNVKESQVSWSFALDNAVEDFEQLIFLLNHGLESLFAGVSKYGHSTEQLDISFKLANRASRRYEIKTSFPTLDRSFWLKLVNVRVSLDPPEAGIKEVEVIAHFTKPRPNQRGLYAVSRPEPENLLLTVGKLKKLVGEENVGIPRLVDQRLAYPFTLDADALPEGKEKLSEPVKPAVFDRGRNIPDDRRSETACLTETKVVVAFNHFRPPLAAEVLMRDGEIVFIKTREFSGHVLNSSGVWRSASRWWDKPWKVQEWDIEIENNGIYRLSKAGKEWFVTGEYD